MTTSKPLVSILIPCYNHVGFLDDCIQGLLYQEYKNLEIFICDDCSTDGSFEKILCYENALKAVFPRVELMQNAINQGITKNLNKMLEMASGDWIKILASDDCLAPDAIKEYISYATVQTDAEVLLANGSYVEEEQHYPFETTMRDIYKMPPDLTQNTLFERIYVENIISAPATMVARTVYEKYGLYDESFAIEDLEYWLRITRDKSIRIGYVDKKLVFYRIGNQSMTSQQYNQQLEKRRLRFHKAEVAILDKYKDAVSERLYANTLLGRYMMEYRTAIKYQLPELEMFTKKKIEDFGNWNDVDQDFRKQCKCSLLKQRVKKILQKNR